MSLPESIPTRELQAFIDRCHAALTDQSQGRPDPFLELWSRSADVTLMAAIGGYQIGFDAVSQLLTAASKTQQFDGWSAENLATIVNGELALTVELEHYARTVDGKNKAMTLRATQVYRREDEQWRVIHRHGDILTPIEAQW